MAFLSNFIQKIRGGAEVFTSEKAREESGILDSLKPVKNVLSNIVNVARHKPTNVKEETQGRMMPFNALNESKVLSGQSMFRTPNQSPMDDIKRTQEFIKRIKFQVPGFNKPGIVFPDKAGEVQQKVVEFLAPKTQEEALAQAAVDFTPLGFAGRVEQKVVTKAREPVFKGLKNLSTKLLESFRELPEKIKAGRFEEVINLAKKTGIKEVDENIVRNSIVKDVQGNVDLPKTAAKVEEKLVPLTPTPVTNPRYSRIGEDFIGEGRYGEIIYQSPVKTSAGDVHFGLDRGALPGEPGSGKGFPNYFSHIRYEDTGNTRKILEVQSDLFQKGRLEGEIPSYLNPTDYLPKELQSELQKVSKQILDIESPNNIRGVTPYADELKELKARRKQILAQAEPAQTKAISNRTSEIAKLQPYNSNDPLAQLRTFREEVKRAAKDGKDTLLIPSGETAMKIEGLGEQTTFYRTTQRFPPPEGLPSAITYDEIKVGDTIYHRDGSPWIATDKLGDGKFKAITRDGMATRLGIGESALRDMTNERLVRAVNNSPALESAKETFDISGKVDTSHFVYKLNESAIPKEARKMGLEVTGKVDVDNGTWWQIKIPKERGRLPVEAFGVLPLFSPDLRNQMLGLMGIKKEETTKSKTQENFKNYPELISETKTDVRGDPIRYRPKVSGGFGVRAESIGEKYGIEPAVLKAILMTESDMGTLKNPDAKGKFGWLTGIMTSAKEQLEIDKKDFDLNTVYGAIDAAAQYWNIVKTRKGVDSNNAVDVYIRNYETSNDPEIRKRFEYYLNAYRHGNSG